MKRDLLMIALFALLVKLDSRGPVLFKQRRYGFNNELIEVYKFRSMTTMDNDSISDWLMPAMMEGMASGSCTLTSSTISKLTASTSFTVSNVSGNGMTYDASQNAVTQISISKP